MAPLGGLSEESADSGSEDSSLSDSEVSPVPAPRGGLAPALLLTLLLFSPQLQEAFAKGALKPGLNVVLEGRPKQPNDVVSVLAEKSVRETLSGSIWGFRKLAFFNYGARHPGDLSPMCECRIVQTTGVIYNQNRFKKER